MEHLVGKNSRMQVSHSRQVSRISIMSDLRMASDQLDYSKTSVHHSSSKSFCSNQAVSTLENHKAIAENSLYLISMLKSQVAELQAENERLRVRLT
jgi:hypothetical protein